MMLIEEIPRRGLRRAMLIGAAPFLALSCIVVTLVIALLVALCAARSIAAESLAEIRNVWSQ